MRIVIDLQGAQTESRFRGIGRYSQALALAIAKNPRHHEIWIVLNAAFPSSAIEIRNLFRDYLPAERIQLFNPPPDIGEMDTKDLTKTRIAEKIREHFILQLKPDIVLVTSLFEGYLDNAVTSIGTLSQQIRTAVILYDLIPLQNEAVYLSTGSHRNYYYNKICSLKNANLLLSISEYSRQCALDLLKISPTQVVNISSAVDPFFQPKRLSSSEIIAFKSKWNIKKKIILYVLGGFDPRKNIQNFIIAYSLIPRSLRKQYQLVITSKINDFNRNILNNLCIKLNIKLDDVIITDYVSNDELLTFYNLTDLFVFPSLCEGFGLPVLEAMSCGAPVIGSNNTSIPEVIGYSDALFDASSPESIAAKIEQVLTNPDFGSKLRQHGLQQSQQFSWEIVATNTLDALEKNITLQSLKPLVNNKPLPRLAFVSPLPPQRTGIADYSAQLLPELTNYYYIDIITDEENLEHIDSISIKSTMWFLQNAHEYDRIIYQFGNSPFHTHMLQLLEDHPGIIMLHDFFLSSLYAYEDISGNIPEIWSKALLTSHGYSALQSRFQQDIEATKNIYPCNLNVLQKAKGILVHSEHSKSLANHWYGPESSVEWQTIPLVRKQPIKKNKLLSRNHLKIENDFFVVCSFGLMDSTKLNHRLIKAWKASTLALHPECKLIFVGGQHGGEYGQDILQQIKQTNIHLAGWCDETTYYNYLEAADLAVQLRTHSRGETSAAVLDCLNYGLPTIINANGSMAELPANAVWMLDDNFTDVELTHALETLWKDVERRKQLKSNAESYILEIHTPAHCASLYHSSIESVYATSVDENSLIRAISATTQKMPSNEDLKQIAKSISYSSALTPRLKQILIDVSDISKNDLKTGIQRVVRAQLLELIKQQPPGYIVEPIYLTQTNNTFHYRYARQYTCSILNITCKNIEDSLVEVFPGDIFYGADYTGHEIIQAANTGIFEYWKASGVSINMLIYDLLPIQHPEFFPPGADLTHTSWLKEITSFADRIIGISYTVANDVFHWLEKNAIQRAHPLKINATPLGADIFSSAPTKGLPDCSVKTLDRLKKNKSFLMVGTIEPRKGYLQTIEAFETLWAEGYEFNLVIVGKEGWIPVPSHQRRTIPVIINTIKHHPELGKRLFWLNDVSDEYLEKIYNSCSCLIAASEGEGFGLPLIEAAKYQLPIIARDLPVFRELADDNAYYFSGTTGNQLSSAIKTWVELNKKNLEPKSDKIKWLSWEENVNNLIPILFNQCQDRTWAPPAIKTKALNEHLHLIHKARVTMVSTLLPAATHILDLGGANSPLYKMGYSYPFEKLTLIDLPQDKRHEYYQEITIDDHCALGPVVIRYTDMTTLTDIPDESIDFVWSGQSIEHVPIDAGERMCREVFRVLKKGGAFCLDTPNRYLTQIHTRSIGGGFIHPEHYIEYFPEQLKKMLIEAGFFIKKALGICDMPETVATNEFHYSDFLFGNQITEKIENAYIQFFHCIKN